MRKTFLLISLALLLGACTQEGPLYKDARYSAERRSQDLLQRMTLEEKLGQLLFPLGCPMY